MRKEVLAAIITGIVLGVIVAFGVWRTNVAFKPESQVSQSETSTPTPQQTKVENGVITIAKPEQNQVIGKTPVKISGITEGNSWIVISGEEEDYVLKSGENGEFEQEVDLIGGVNQLIIAAFDEEGKESKSSLVLVYSTEFSDQVEEPTPTATGTGSEDSVSEKVQERLVEASKIPIAYLGTITDIADTILQTKTIAGEIRQVSVDQEETSYIKINKKSKNIEFSDVAIGDFIVAMGYKDENDVLETIRLLVTDPVSPPERKVVYTKVLEVKKNELVVQFEDEEQISLLPADESVVTIEEEGKLKEIKFADIEEGARIIAAGAAEAETFTARTIRVISTPEPSPTGEVSPVEEE